MLSETSKSRGRPPVITAEVVSILITSFQNGLNVRESCWQAGISHEAFYEKMRQDKDFTDTIERAKCSPAIKAKANIVKAINNGDVSISKWWLEKRQPKDFGQKVDIQQEEELKPENPFSSMSDEEFYSFASDIQHLLPVSLKDH